MLNRFNKYLTPRNLISGSVFALFLSQRFMIPSVDDESKHSEIGMQQLTSLIGIILALRGLKYFLDYSTILNTHTFLSRSAISDIHPDKLIILDHYAFDIDELVSYAQNDLAKIYKNPHQGEFSAAAKKIIKNHQAFAEFITRLERRLVNQKKRISLVTIDKIKEMLLDIDKGLSQRDIKTETDLQPEQEEELEFDLEWQDAPSDNEQDDVDLLEILFRNVVEQSPITNTRAFIHESEYVPPACEEARLKFAKYTDTLGKKKRSYLNNYIIEVPSTLDGKQRLKFKDALIGGNMFEPCITTLQIFLWQMVVNYQPEALKLVPKPVTAAAYKFNLEIKPPNYKPTFIGNLLNFTTSRRNRFFTIDSLDDSDTEDFTPPPLVNTRAALR